MDRRCYACAAPIAECMGFTLVRTVHFLNHAYPPELPIWELCGRCALLDEVIPILTYDY
jgi:hypothetical protein